MWNLTDDASTTALLLIDVINDLEFEGGEDLLFHALPMAHQIHDLKQAAKAADVPVIYANDNFGQWRSDFRRLVHSCCEKPVRGQEIARLLKPDEDDYFVLKLDIKSWTLKIYYELKYFEQAISFIDSYRHFLSKNSSISPQLKERHLSFLKFTSDLIKLKAHSDGFSVKKMKTELANNNNIVHKDWIAEKISETEL